MNWLSRNKCRLIFAATIGILAFIIALPAFAKQDVSVGDVRELSNSKPCIDARAYIDLKRLVLIALANVEGSATFDQMAVFEDGTIMTLNRGCVVDMISN